MSSVRSAGHGPGGGGMLSAVLEHYARYQNKKAKKGGLAGTGGDDSISSSNVMEVDSIYRSSINGRYELCRADLFEPFVLLPYPLTRIVVGLQWYRISCERSYMQGVFTGAFL